MPKNESLRTWRHPDDQVPSAHLQPRDGWILGHLAECFNTLLARWHPTPTADQSAPKYTNQPAKGRTRYPSRRSTRLFGLSDSPRNPLSLCDACLDHPPPPASKICFSLAHTPKQLPEQHAEKVGIYVGETISPTRLVAGKASSGLAREAQRRRHLRQPRAESVTLPIIPLDKPRRPI